jgi:DNA gyrase subunit A
VAPDEEVLVLTTDGTAIKLKADTVSLQHRDSKGVIVISLKEGSAVASVARVVPGGEE